MQVLTDFEGAPLNIGDSVVFISAPNTLQKGLITGFKPLSKILTVVEIVVTLPSGSLVTTPNGSNYTLTAAPFVCAKLS